MCSASVSAELSDSIIKFSQELANLRVPDVCSWGGGPYELPEQVAERGFRAAHIGFLIGSLEGIESPERVCSQILFRELPAVLEESRFPINRHTDEDYYTAAIEAFSRRLGSVGDFLVEIWKEGAALASTHSIVAEDAYNLSEAFSLLEQKARGNLSTGARLEAIAQMLVTESAKELLNEASAVSPFRYWQEFSSSDPLLKGFADYVYEIGKLRLESRSGWQYLGIRHESVAAHTFRAAQIGTVMAFLSESVEPGLGAVCPHRVAAEVTMHENGECRIQDVNLVAKNYVSYREVEAVAHQTLNMGDVGSQVRGMWEAVEFRSTPSGMIAKDVDRLEMVIEAANLVAKGIPAARSWIDNTRPMLGTRIGQILCEAVEKTI